MTFLFTGGYFDYFKYNVIIFFETYDSQFMIPDLRVMDLYNSRCNFLFDNLENGIVDSPRLRGAFSLYPFPIYVTLFKIFSRFTFHCFSLLWTLNYTRYDHPIFSLSCSPMLTSDEIPRV